MNCLYSKKAVSPIIATVLLISIVISMAVIIYMYQSGFVTEQISKFNKPAETNCQEINFDWHFEPKVYGSEIGELSVNNRGNIHISQVNVKAICKGSSITRNFVESVLIGETKTFKIDTSNFTNLENCNTEDSPEMEVVPLIAGTGLKSGKVKLFTCDGQALKKVINLAS